MHALIFVTLTCWLCALIATPRKPRVGDEAAELIYSLLLSRQQRLALLAFLSTAALFLSLVLSLPQRVDATLYTAPTSVAGSTAGCNDEMLCPWIYRLPRASDNGR